MDFLPVRWPSWRGAGLLLSLFCLGLLPAKGQTRLGNLTGIMDSGRSLLLQTIEPAVRLTFITPTIIRVDLLPVRYAQPDSSFSVVQDTTVSVTTTRTLTDSLLLFSSSSVTVVCRTTPLRLSFVAGGRTVLEEAPEGGLGFDGHARLAGFVLTGEDHFYGTGERGMGLDLRGQAFDLYNTQVGGYGDAPQVMNINIPFIAGARGTALFFDTPWPARVDLGFSDPGRFTYRAEGGELSFYVIAAPTVPEQLEQYTWLTGRQPLPPRWAFGYLQSRFGYRTESEARALVTSFRQHRIPCDAVILDLYWFKDMGDISWDLSSWPAPFQMMADFLREGIHTIVITEPYLTTSSTNFAEAAALGHLAKTRAGSPYLLGNWWYRNSTATLLDMTSPAARTWWWSKHPQFFGSSLAGIWTDLGEPERHPEDMVHALGPARKVHNIYNLLWAQCIAEGYATLRPKERLFNITRSGFAGIQRYGVITWSGDVSKSFSGLAAQVPLLLNMGLSGLAYHNSDIGGFTGPPAPPELYVRWLQFGAFCPIMRAHGAGSPTEPWAFGTEAETIARSFLELRYRLIPYLYSAAAENHRTGMPIIRPLFFMDSERRQDPSSYLFGDAILVSPVTRSAQTTATVALPNGDWVDYWSDQLYDGGRTVTVATPLSTIPLFVRAGSIIPMKVSRNSTSDQPADSLLLSLYPASGRAARYTLYEDDGTSLDYLSGSFSTTEFAEEDDPTIGTMRIRLGQSTGQYTGKPGRRDYMIDVHRMMTPPTGVRKGELPIPKASSPAQLAAMEGYLYDGARAVVSIHIGADTDSTTVLTLENVSVSAVPRAGETPVSFRLEQNFPNPFNPMTVVSFELPRACEVRLVVNDLLGRDVAVLVDGWMEAGRHSVQFDAQGLGSGVYFARLRAGSWIAAREMVLIK